jgi:hypothetical protein
MPAEHAAHAEHPLTLHQLTALADASAAVTQPCACAINTYRAWTRVPVEFPHVQMRTVGTLIADPYGEPTFAEYHPHGTTSWSPDAPIAPRHYPYNRASVLRCGVCGRCTLHYVEAGGYYVEPRIRALDPALIVDVPAPD